MKKRRLLKKRLAEAAALAPRLFFLGRGGTLLWLGNMEIPNLDTIGERRVSQSTKIFDRTGEILLYDIHKDVRRTVVPFDQISRNIKNATVAIEDASFYQHNGIEPRAILRAVFANLTDFGYSQGGSTITQQVVKNSILTNDKTITRKLKEWVLALKLEKTKSKEERKNFALERMLAEHFINQEEYESAKKEIVNWLPPSDVGIRAPHFVMFIKDYLENKYGEEKVRDGGFKVTTTLDYS